MAVAGRRMAPVTPAWAVAGGPSQVPLALQT